MPATHVDALRNRGVIEEGPVQGRGGEYEVVQLDRGARGQAHVDGLRLWLWLWMFIWLKVAVLFWGRGGGAELDQGSGSRFTVKMMKMMMKMMIR